VFGDQTAVQNKRGDAPKRALADHVGTDARVAVIEADVSRSHTILDIAAEKGNRVNREPKSELRCDAGRVNRVARVNLLEHGPRGLTLLRLFREIPTRHCPRRNKKSICSRHALAIGYTR